MTVAMEKEEMKPLVRSDLARVSGAEVRLAIRERRWTGTTTRLALGREQANLVILPERYAFDFMRFCLRNPKPLPLMEVTDPGDPEPRQTAPGADIRTDVTAYRLYRDGELVDEVSDLRELWRRDHVAFLTGCNLSLDQVMLEANIPLPHLMREDAWTSQYISNIACVPAGIFAGPQVASMRPLPKSKVIKFIEISSRYPRNHGAPIHVGDPAAIGIDDLDSFKWGKRNVIGHDEVPVFCACGVTAHAVALAARIPEMITHKPGHMFVTDLPILDPTATTVSV
jgi:uncharacterized protein YcsI (UPF0317 family)